MGAVTDSYLQTFLATTPDWLVGLMLLTIGGLVAVILHALAIRTISGLFGGRHAHARSLIHRTNGLTRLATVILVLSGTVRLTALDPDTTRIVSNGLVVAFVIM